MSLWAGNACLLPVAGRQRLVRVWQTKDTGFLEGKRSGIVTNHEGFVFFFLLRTWFLNPYPHCKKNHIISGAAT